jgi:hypothetical protein
MLWKPKVAHLTVLPSAKNMRTYLCTEEATWVKKHWQEKGVPMIYSVIDQLREVLLRADYAL